MLHFISRTFVCWLRAPALARRGAARSRRAAAPRELASGVAVFAALTVALAVTVETVRPEWRDPEYGHRLKRVRAYQKANPDRPLVLVFGSSRAQMGVAPAAMGFADRPGEPVVYNFGYRAGPPLVSWLMFTRALDDGLRPRAVLLVIGFDKALMNVTAENQFGSRASRLSGADLRRLEPFTGNPAGLRERLWAARRCPLVAHRGALVSDLFPAAQCAPVRGQHRSWEAMDDYGFVRFPDAGTAEDNRRPLRERARELVRSTDVPARSPISDRAVSHLVARCRAEGVAVAVAWAPESPWFRGLYTPTAREAATAYSRALTTELGVPVLPAPEHLGEEDFVDGYHLTPDGAAKYSRWLGDNHLKPWLAGVLK